MNSFTFYGPVLVQKLIGTSIIMKNVKLLLLIYAMHSLEFICQNKVEFLGLGEHLRSCWTSLYQHPKSCQMSFYRSLSQNRAYPVERGSSSARFPWSVVTAGWSRTPSVASVALCRASPTWAAHRSKSGRCVRTFFIIDFSLGVQIHLQLYFLSDMLLQRWQFAPFLICF